MENRMDYTDAFKYVVFRVFIFVELTVLAPVLCFAVAWVIKPAFDFSVGLTSLASLILMTAILSVLMMSDAKKHAAYQNADLVTAATAEIFMFAAYFIPTIFVDDTSTSFVKNFFKLTHIPTFWIQRIASGDVKVSSALGMAAVIVVSSAAYQIVFSLYKRKHPIRLRTSGPDADCE